MENKYLALHPISEKPEKDGRYRLFYDDNKFGLNLRSFKNGEWDFMPIANPSITHWLSNEPVTGVLVSEEELREVLESSYLSGFMQEDKDQTVDNLTNKLSNQ